MADEKWKLASLVIEAVVSRIREKVRVTKKKPLKQTEKTPSPPTEGEDAVLYGKRL